MGISEPVPARMIITSLLLLLVFLLPAVAEETPGRGESERPAVILREEEVLEYEGERLSPIDISFRENSIAGPQHINGSDYTLIIDGLVHGSKEFTCDDVLTFASYKKVVTLRCVTGWSAKILWEGVLVRDLIDRAGRKKDASIVILHAHDGYTTSFPIAFFYDEDIIMAYKINGIILPPERGFPFQLVAENKYGYKWIKWIVRIELSDDLAHRGYWESRGYDNEADLRPNEVDDP